MADQVGGGGDVLDGFEAQLNGGAEETSSVDTGNGHMYGPSEGLDPSIIGEQLASQRAEYDQKFNQLNTAHAEKIGGMTNEMAQMRAQMEQLSGAIPNQAPEDPYATKYGLTEDERAEMEPFLSGVDKRAQAAVEVGLGKVTERFQQQLEAERSQFTKALETLRSEVQLTHTDSQQAFEASTSSMARSYGLQLSELANNAEWNEFLKQPASYVDNTTFYDVLSGSVKAKDLAKAERVFARFAETRQTPADQLTGLPNQGGPREQQQNAPDDAMTALKNKREMIITKGREYRAQVESRRMSAADFAQKVAALEQLEGQVLAEMNAHAANNPNASAQQI